MEKEVVPLSIELNDLFTLVGKIKDKFASDINGKKQEEIIKLLFHRCDPNGRGEILTNTIINYGISVGVGYYTSSKLYDSVWGTNNYCNVVLDKIVTETLKPLLSRDVVDIIKNISIYNSIVKSIISLIANDLVHPAIENAITKEQPGKKKDRLYQLQEKLKKKDSNDFAFIENLVNSLITKFLKTDNAVGEIKKVFNSIYSGEGAEEGLKKYIKKTINDLYNAYKSLPIEEKNVSFGTDISEIFDYIPLLLDALLTYVLEDLTNNHDVRWLIQTSILQTKEIQQFINEPYNFKEELRDSIEDIALTTKPEIAILALNQAINIFIDDILPEYEEAMAENDNDKKNDKIEIFKITLTFLSSIINLFDYTDNIEFNREKISLYEMITYFIKVKKLINLLNEKKDQEIYQGVKENINTLQEKIKKTKFYKEIINAEHLPDEIFDKYLPQNQCSTGTGSSKHLAHNVEENQYFLSLKYIPFLLSDVLSDKQKSCIKKQNIQITYNKKYNNVEHKNYEGKNDIYVFLRDFFVSTTKKSKDFQSFFESFFDTQKILWDDKSDNFLDFINNDEKTNGYFENNDEKIETTTKNSVFVLKWMYLIYYAPKQDREKLLNFTTNNYNIILNDSNESDLTEKYILPHILLPILLNVIEKEDEEDVSLEILKFFSDLTSLKLTDNTKINVNPINLLQKYIYRKDIFIQLINNKSISIQKLFYIIKLIDNSIKQDLLLKKPADKEYKEAGIYWYIEENQEKENKLDGTKYIKDCFKICTNNFIDKLNSATEVDINNFRLDILEDILVNDIFVKNDKNIEKEKALQVLKSYLKNKISTFNSIAEEEKENFQKETIKYINENIIQKNHEKFSANDIIKILNEISGENSISNLERNIIIGINPDTNSLSEEDKKFLITNHISISINNQETIKDFLIKPSHDNIATESNQKNSGSININEKKGSKEVSGKTCKMPKLFYYAAMKKCQNDDDHIIIDNKGNNFKEMVTKFDAIIKREKESKELNINFSLHFQDEREFINYIKDFLINDISFIEKKIELIKANSLLGEVSITFNIDNFNIYELLEDQNNIDRTRKIMMLLDAFFEVSQKERIETLNILTIIDNIEKREDINNMELKKEPKFLSAIIEVLNIYIKEFIKGEENRNHSTYQSILLCLNIILELENKITSEEIQSSKPKWNLPEILKKHTNEKALRIKSLLKFYLPTISKLFNILDDNIIQPKKDDFEKLSNDYFARSLYVKNIYETTQKGQINSNNNLNQFSKYYLTSRYIDSNVTLSSDEEDNILKMFKTLYANIKKPRSNEKLNDIFSLVDIRTILNFQTEKEKINASVSSMLKTNSIVPEHIETILNFINESNILEQKNFQLYMRSLFVKSFSFKDDFIFTIDESLTDRYSISKKYQLFSKVDNKQNLFDLLYSEYSAKFNHSALEIWNSIIKFVYDGIALLPENKIQDPFFKYKHYLNLLLEKKELNEFNFKNIVDYYHNKPDDFENKNEYITVAKILSPSESQIIFVKKNLFYKTLIKNSSDIYIHFTKNEFNQFYFVEKNIQSNKFIYPESFDYSNHDIEGKIHTAMGDNFSSNDDLIYTDIFLSSDFIIKVIFLIE